MRRLEGIPEKYASNRSKPLARFNMARITTEQVDLYQQVTSPWENFLVAVETFSIDVIVLEEEKR